MQAYIELNERITVQPTSIHYTLIQTLIMFHNTTDSRQLTYNIAYLEYDLQQPKHIAETPLS